MTNHYLKEEAIKTLHASPALVSIVCTGAGAGLQGLLSNLPGASATILEASYPYHQEALKAFLDGFMPEKCACEETALRMAVHARERGREIDMKRGGNGEQVIGLGLTGAIATDKPKRGEHRVHIATAGPRGIFVVTATFSKNPEGFSLIGRKREGESSDELGLQMILHAAGLEQFPMDMIGRNSECVIPDKSEPGHYKLSPRKIIPLAETVSPSELWERPLFLPDGTRIPTSELSADKHILFGGSFDPLHYGHLLLAREAARVDGRQVVFVITAKHPSKGEVSETELLARAEQFRFLGPVLFTREEGLFRDKAEVYPGFTFLIGVDTLLGILNPDYYDEEVHEVLRILREECRCRFFVAGRRIGDRFVTLDMVLREQRVVIDHWPMFSPLGDRADVASRNLRLGTVK